jgi:hypothetical protein
MRILFAIVCLGFATSSWSASKPNVLFIAIDDLAPALRCYGILMAKMPQFSVLTRGVPMGKK